MVYDCFTETRRSITKVMSSKKPPKDRVSVDVEGLREEVEKAYKTIAWGETPFATKIRILVMEKLSELAKAADPDSNEE